MSDDKRAPRAHAQYGPTAQTVAANILRLRTARSLSTYGLSRLLEGAGRTIAPSSITKIEQCRRQVTVDELMALAVVLNVNPAMLLLPNTVQGDTELTGAGQVTAAAAWDWFRKDMPLRTPPDDDGSAIVEFRLNLPRGIRKFNITSPAGRRAALESDRESLDGGEPDGPSVD
ncbi:helix-turn-helix domain-containing protein [Streptomyces smyrnaeus]|uniref:helix-turn-helix domain-containing protein n=1 Tax=Streptomyces smyrnaeus TaxID=1387713 RepID=UPI0033EBA820